jgi:hypothetical protein
MLEKITKNFINRIILEIKKPDNKKKLEENIINPIFSNLTDKIYPYVSLLFIMYSLSLILIIIILILIIIYNKK